MKKRSFFILVIIRATYLLNKQAESAIADDRARKREFANFGG